MKKILTIGRHGAAFALILAASCFAPAKAQDFGFGDESATALAEAAPAGGASVGGKLEFAATSFFKAADDALESPLDGAAQGRLDFAAQGGSVDASLMLRLSEKVLSENPSSVVDQASLKLFAGPLTLEGGLLKASWGKADSQGPLDVLNPQDLTDLTITDQLDRKIAMPMLRARAALGSSAQLELAGVFGFEGNRIAFEGPWMPKLVADKKTAAYQGFYYGANPAANGGKGDGLYANYYSTAWATAYASAYPAVYASAYTTAYNAAYAGALVATSGDIGSSVAAAVNAANNAVITATSNAATAACAANASAIAAQAAAAAEARIAGLLSYPRTDTVEWSQGGARLTGSLGGIDAGLQYFYGFLPNPVASSDPAVLAANGGKLPVSYNRYHQIGVDMAAVLAGFNLRVEAAANLTDDMKGDDPSVYNPHLAWSLGFDRELFAAITLNVQGTGTYRLFDEGVEDKPYDIETGTDPTRTKITAMLSRGFL
ncbi:MAG: hypothetical protein Q8M76_06305, partial [Spirochaetaceae bacterium]|nr:hypothetical protein [Spirochaetaceae bacterium]